MTTCRKVRGQLAASLYEHLADEERRALDRHLEGCARCRAEFEGLQTLVSGIPAEPVAFTGDLRPALFEKIRESAPSRTVRVFSMRWQWVGVAAVALVVAGVFSVLTVLDNDEASAPALVNVTMSPVEASLEESERLMEERNYSAAYLTLADGLEASPDTPVAAAALERMGEIAFVELRWYPEAYEAYKTLQQEHFDQFKSTQDNILRLEILDESRGPDNQYAALHALDHARAVDTFEGYEAVAADYAGKYVGALAARDMARTVGEEQDADLVTAMELALERSTNPLAVDQVKLELAAVLRGDGQQLDRARSLYEEVVDSGNRILARAAQDSLQELGAAP